MLNQHIFKVVFDKIDIDKSYFKYVVEKGLQDAVKHTHGSTMKHLTKNILIILWFHIQI
ncbi:hypothetical protein SPAR5_0853 [Streptococcus pneumoniae GA04375]|nr:hypothetical protein SPAR5_0853 [Streptococcus pneumoniae GA04375]